ncbi:YjjG family noncanonical pyrimidine nucleotidase [Clostridiaceae bacterium M8S5]|nr:YjjG family noncanonical pyrimidine nucleotidase [Clostridiaceae bacterium M8S5]
MKYEVILFDADETLFDFKKTEKYALEKTMIEFGINYNEDYHLNIYKEINKNIWEELEKGLITQEELKIERFNRYLRALNIDNDAEKFAKSYLKHLANGSYLIKGAKETLNILNDNCKMIIITNGLKCVQNKRIRQSEIAKYFEKIVISEEVGVTKPDTEIFNIALKNIDYTDKSKILMVGDRIQSDIKGGANFSIDTCWYNPSRIKNTFSTKPTYQISKLQELEDIVNLSKVTG